MNTILTLQDSDMNPFTQPGDRDDYFQRRAARAVMTDENGAVALMHVTMEGYYKLPGGGVDEGEDVLAALERELGEETGSRGKVTDEIGIVIEYRDFMEMVQTSYAYRAVLEGEKGEPKLTDKEIEEGFEVVWVENIDKAIELIKPGCERTDQLGIAFMSRRDIAILQAAKVLV